MDLRTRLEALRRQSGAATAEHPPEGGVEARLKRLGVAGRTAPRAGHHPFDAGVLAADMGGRSLADGVLLLERSVPLEERHGRIPLSGLGEPIRVPGLGGPVPRDPVFLDTETTGLAGGTGTLAFMVGAARVENGRIAVRQYLLTAFQGEIAMLSHLGQWLRDAPTLVTFNGKCFDLPLLKDRYRLAGFRDHLGPAEHLDLLHPVRRLFGGRWPDCRLATVEERLLGFHRRNDIAGAQVPRVWFDLVHRGDASRLPDVARHNRWDLLSLAALLPVLAFAHGRPGDWDACPRAAARAWLGHGDERRARAVLEGCEAELDERAALELARLHRRQGDWAQAVAVWERLAAGGSRTAVEQLAKYHEHVRRDWRTAMHYAQRLPDAAWRRARLRRRLRADAVNGELDLG